MSQVLLLGIPDVVIDAILGWGPGRGADAGPARVTDGSAVRPGEPPEADREENRDGHTSEGRTTCAVRPSGLAEDTRFELVRGCPQHAFQACALGL